MPNRTEATLWGIVGQVRFDAVRAVDQPSGPGAQSPVASQWRSPEERIALCRWGQRQTDWYVPSDSDLLVIADATLYDTPTLCAALAVDPDDRGVASLLAAAYRRWGEDMCSHLDGDFAFIICDRRAGSVFAAVDPMGVRPLFYHHDPGRSFTFSSGDDTLARWAGLDPRIPESRLLEPLLNLEELRHFRSDIPGVTRLQAAHACHVDASGLRTWRYWSAGARRPDLAAHDIDGWVEGLRTQLHHAVRKRMADGARIGVMFSGGLDSASALALATQIAPAAGITAYSLLDRGRPDCPETRAIDRTIAATGARLVPLDIADMQAHIAPSLKFLSSTRRFNFIGNGFLPYLSAIAAADGIDAMMNGYDADAMFTISDLLQRRLRQGDYRGALRDAQEIDRGLGVPDFVPQVRRLRLKQWLPPSLEAPLRGPWQRVRSARTLRNALLNPDAARRLQLRERLQEYRDLTHRDTNVRGPALPASLMQIPTVVDGVARSEWRFRFGGVQMRSPFLDRDLIDFAAWIPLELRLREGRFKWILRKAMDPHLPHDVTWRRDKLHLGSHHARALLQPLLKSVLRDFDGSGPAIAPYVDRKRFEAQARLWMQGQISAVWALAPWLELEHWLQHNRDRVAWGL